MKGSICLFLFFWSIGVSAQRDLLPDGFVYVQDKIPGIVYDLRYYGKHNFTGKKVDGYLRPVAILSKPAAAALQNVQLALNQKGLGLQIFDAYRPQRAVDRFIIWARNPADTLAKQEFYPHVPKSDLFKRGYIASRSGHSRGSTVDLTIVDTTTGVPLDMGSPFDFFGEISHHGSKQITPAQQKNRYLLKNTMTQHGFQSYSEEWWHYTLAHEPYPNTYFDFPVQ